MSRKQTRRLDGGEGWSFNATDKKPVVNRIGGNKIIRLRMEKRRGKPTTILYDMEGVTDLKLLAKQLKNLVSAGGTTKDNKIEIQGEHRDRFRVYLSDEGYEVKG